MRVRIERARDDSDVAYFYELLYAAEMATKVTVAALVGCLEPDRDRHQYRLEYELVRSDGLGAWSAALEDCLTGAASQALSPDARGLQQELTQTRRVHDGGWGFGAVSRLDGARRAIDPDLEPLPAKVAVRRWFADFAALRNRTRGHGATRPSACSQAAPLLAESLDLVLDGLSLFKLPWAHLRRNLSGKYLVTDLGNGDTPFEKLRTNKDFAFHDGIYMAAGSPRLIGLLSTDDDVRDFFLPNGGATNRRYEVLSYITDNKLTVPIDDYAAPPSALPPSETEGRGALEPAGNVFTNLPPDTTGYIQRPELEQSLEDLLMNDRHPVITLVGRGGIGKTSLALHVLHSAAETDRYFSIIWFSSRDIELLPEGPKLVRPHLLTQEDMAGEYVELAGAPTRGEGGLKPIDEFAKALGDRGDSPTLFVFDNFETVRSPLELYRWLDTHIRSPNKILITTRSREFKGDYWLEVSGMTEEQFEELVSGTAASVGVKHLLTPEYISDLYRESDGHPYVAKVLLGEIARAGERRNVKRIMASQDHVLEALFERTYSQLSPAAQRIFLTLSSWRSLVPVVALEAAVQRPQNERLDVDAALDELRRSSLLEFSRTNASDRYVSVPLSAALFGKRKEATSPWKTAIEADVEVLQMFGPVQAPSVQGVGLDAQVARMYQAVASRVQKRPEEFERYRPVLEFVSREQPIGWRLLGQLLEEQRPSKEWARDSAVAYRLYLDTAPEDDGAWRALARVAQAQGDFMGSIQALIERARLPQATFADVSYAASRVNIWLYEQRLELDSDEKRILLSSLVDVMNGRRDEADATDLSRLAWLLLHLGRSAEAKDVVEWALDIDGSDPHCRKLATRLGVAAPAD